MQAARNKIILILIISFLFRMSVTAQSNATYIDPTIGNVSQLLQPTRPTMQLPNQVMRMSPVRNDYIDDQISSFPLIILSHRLGQAFAIKPSVRTPGTAGWKQRMTYDHDLEITRPWYYSTWLIDEDIRVEFTPGKKTGIYRFVFPQSAARKSLLFDVYNKGRSGWKSISDREITGFETYHEDIAIYMYGVFSVPAQAMKVKDSGRAERAMGQAEGVNMVFPEGTADTVEFRYAISYISQEQARQNYETELNAMSFERLRDRGEQAWNRVADQVQVEGGSSQQKRTFYTALYRCHERMVDISEGGQYYSGFDKKIHRSPRGFYVDDWSWDTYLALHPLRMILDPSLEEDMLDSYVTMYQQSGWMPTFPVLFGDHACMNGFHSSIVFLDAYRKGLRRFDASVAFAGMKKNAMEATMLPWRNGPKCSLDDFYQARGYFPALYPGEKENIDLVNPFEKRQAVAVTLGASYDDWAVGEMAKELGMPDDYKTFHARGANYKNLWNEKEQLFIPKDNKGNWINIDPKYDGGKGGRDFYDENNGWTYLWQVQEDLKGLIGLMGGKDAFENRLDQLFREPLGRSRSEFWSKFPDATGLVGQYSMGNEPSFHIPYLYNFTGAPWKTQKHIRFLLDTWFKDNVFGIPGDEDGGGMSAFVVFSSMGFYPVTPGIPVYTIGSPVFEKVRIALSGGKTFTVIAKDCSKINKYIQRAAFDGKPLDTPWFTHEQLMAGGVLELEMGPFPNKSWGIDK